MAIGNTLARSWRIFKDAAGVWFERNAFMHAGSLAFFTLFSMAPVVIIAIAIVGMALGPDAAQGRIKAQIEQFLGADAARVIQDVVARSRPEIAGILPTLTGLLALFAGATSVFGQMQFSLNRIWGVAATPRKSGFITFLKTRIVSLAIVIAIGFVLLVSLLLDLAVEAAIAYARGWIPVPPLVLASTEMIVSFTVIAALFAVIFKALPDVVIDWEDVRAGAIITALLFVAGRSGIALYLTYTAPASAYGAAGSLVLVLLWVYYSSLILYFGAALTRARVLAHGKPIYPRATAVRVREEVIEEEH